MITKHLFLTLPAYYAEQSLCLCLSVSLSVLPDQPNFKNSFSP